MTSTVSRGRRIEDYAAAILEKDGWRVDLALPQSRTVWEDGEPKRVNKYDHFGLFDIIAVKDGVVRFIQVTHPSGLRERREKIDDAGWTSTSYTGVEIWVWKTDRFSVRASLHGEWERPQEVRVPGAES